MSEPISVIIADDHEMVRQTLGRWLDSSGGFNVVARVDTADAALAGVIEHHPDVVVLDVDMPGLTSFEAAAQMRERCPGTRVLFLSAFFHDRYIEQALAVGAAGYVAKTEPAEIVAKAIRSVYAGTAYFSNQIEERIVFTSKGMELARKGQSRASTLTSQQVRVLRYLAQGMSKKEIAAMMDLSERTINRHCNNLMEKLDIHDRVELTRFAIREGFVEA